MKRKKQIGLILIILLVDIMFGIKLADMISVHQIISNNEYLNNSSDNKVESRKVGFFTKEDIIVDEDGEAKKSFELSDLKIGDIFITASTHSFGWRHGHAAIVVGVNPLKTLEAESIGKKSRIIQSPLWERYSTFIQLRLKSENGGKYSAEKAAKYCIKNLVNVDYGLLCMKKCNCIKKVNCSFVVWRAYFEVGIDIDNDKGILVTPRDIYNCDYFEVIQRLGI